MNQSVILKVLNYIIEKDFPNKVNIKEIKEYVRGQEKLDDLTEKDIGNAIKAFYDVYNDGSLRIEGFKTALDYIQLKEAREASNKALNVARNAFYVSILVLLVSIYFSLLAIHVDHPEFARWFFHWSS
jgi:hypothetical protein